MPDYWWSILDIDTINRIDGGKDMVKVTQFITANIKVINGVEFFSFENLIPRMFYLFLSLYPHLIFNLSSFNFKPKSL